MPGHAGYFDWEKAEKAGFPSGRFLGLDVNHFNALCKEAGLGPVDHGVYPVGAELTEDAAKQLEIFEGDPKKYMKINL